MLETQERSDLAFLGVRQQTQMFTEGAATPVDTTKAALDRIDAIDPVVNAFSFVDGTGALKAAEASAKRWAAGEPLSPIDGIATTIKDVMMVKGWETTFGSRVLGLGEPSDWYSPAVARLVEAGAVLIGQTTTPEIGWKGVTDNTRHGTTRNPWDPAKTPGGSSGGAGAAAAMGAGVLHVGTDGGGSVRIPAAFCGIFGHKPSYGRVATYPLSPYSTLAHIGPMTRSVEDAAFMLRVMARPDLRDWSALPYEDIDYAAALGAGIEGRRIAYSPDLGYANVNPEVARIVEEAVVLLSSLGAEVVPVDPPFEEPMETVEVLWFAGMAGRIKHLSPAQRDLLDPGLLSMAKQGEAVDLSKFHDATLQRAELGRQMKEYFAEFDYLVTPTCPIPAFDIDTPPDSVGRGWADDWMPFTYPFNLTQQPACSVPCGLTKAGMPVGLQIVGAMFDDLGVLQAAHAFERARPVVTYPGQTSQPQHTA
ncbi:MAG: amidase [Pseudomonadota bacterium]